MFIYYKLEHIERSLIILDDFFLNNVIINFNIFGVFHGRLCWKQFVWLVGYHNTEEQVENKK